MNVDLTDVYKSNETNLKCDSKSNYLNRVNKFEISLFDNARLKNRLVKSSLLLSSQQVSKQKQYSVYMNGFASPPKSASFPISPLNSNNSTTATVVTQSSKSLILRKQTEIKKKISTQIKTGKQQKQLVPKQKLPKQQPQPQQSQDVTSITCSSLSLSTIGSSVANTNYELHQQHQQPQLTSRPLISTSRIQINQNGLESTKSTNLYKSIITVDTSRSKSNSEVLKMCLNELGWMDCSSLCNCNY